MMLTAALAAQAAPSRNPQLRKAAIRLSVDLKMQLGYPFSAQCDFDATSEAIDHSGDPGDLSPHLSMTDHLKMPRSI
jgi:hypothetical protein